MRFGRGKSPLRERNFAAAKRGGELLASDWRPRFRNLWAFPMRARGSPVELDLLDDDVDPEPRAGSCSGLIAPFNYRGRARAPGHAAGSGAMLLATRILIALTIGVAAYGVETDRKGVVMAGLAATAVVAAAMAVSARELIRTGERSCRLLHRALAESERAQYELDAANEALDRSAEGAS